MKIKINVKSVGARKPSVKADDFALPDGAPLSTVGEFLDAVTETCVAQYKKRQEEGDIFKILTQKQIDEKSASGKIGFGVNYGTSSPDLAEARENTRLCYLDGMFALFIDGKEIGGLKTSLPLEAPVDVHEGSEVSFVRLSMLAGLMW